MLSRYETAMEVKPIGGQWSVGGGVNHAST